MLVNEIRPLLVDRAVGEQRVDVGKVRDANHCWPPELGSVGHEEHAAETVKVTYQPKKTNLPFLLTLYFKTIDPTSVNQQGADRGTQYRTGIYYTDAADAVVIEQCVNHLAKNYRQPLAVEVMPLENFYPAELYHQDYLDKNPGGYCHIQPELFELARKAKAE